MNSPLKVFRAARGLSQVDLARDLGVSSITVSRWETGARRIAPDFLAKIHERTGIAPSELRPDLAGKLWPWLQRMAG